MIDLSAKSDFALACLTARLMLYFWVGLSIFLTLFKIMDEDVREGIGYFIDSLIQTGILVAFVYFLKRGSDVAAVAFAFWCLFDLFTAIPGTDSVIATIILYLHGVLGFVGICGVVKGFMKERIQ